VHIVYGVDFDKRTTVSPRGKAFTQAPKKKKRKKDKKKKKEKKKERRAAVVC